jgi:bla regulator protein BlaR1
MFTKLHIALLLTCTLASAQSPAPTRPAFDAASIKPSKYDGSSMTTPATTSDGYHARLQPWRSTILLAYFPEGMSYWGRDRIQGAPAWLDDQYDIDARVGEADLPEWQRERSLKLVQKVLLQQMLQSMLADRSKLVVHRVPSTIAGFALVAKIGKRGQHLTPARPGAVLPNGLTFPDGGVAVGYQNGEPAQETFSSATMSGLIQILNVLSPGHPIVDRTGITDHYDFILRCAETDPDHPSRGCSNATSDDPNPLSHWDLDSLGLHLEPIKVPIDTLIIDHIEKPSEN